MSPRAGRAAFGVLLLFAAFLRISRVRWDEGTHLHPDERFISMVDERLQFPSKIFEYFDSARSSFNPYNRGFNSFVYGTLPLLVTRAAASPIGKTGYDGSYAVGRVMSALFDLLTIWLVYRIARRMTGRGTSLVAAGLYAFSPLAIQLSHFWASDTFLTAFSAAALLGCARIALGRSGAVGDLATAVAVGLAVGCKITALALFAPVGIAILVRRLAPGLPKTVGESLLAARDVSLRLLPMLLVAAVTVRIALPYAFSGSSFFTLRLDPRWIRDIKEISLLQSSVAGFPPAFQWAGRTILYPIGNFVWWGAGPFFGIAALAALPWGIAMCARRKTWLLAPLLVHALFLVLYHGLTIVKAMRYWHPAYPAFAVLAALFLEDLARRARLRRTLLSALLRWSPALALAGTVLAGFAFSRIYTRPVTRVAASDWIYARVAPARFANEAWDDGLPLPRPERNNGAYAGPVLSLFDPDSPAKAAKILEALSGADWIAVTSGRVYSNVTRIPDVFPMTIAYYRALFDGRLGFERKADFTSYPALGPLRFNDDTAEEQFTVYDHPRVLLFRKSPAYSAARAKELLLAAIPTTPPTLNDWEKWPRSKRRVASPVRPSENRAAEQPLLPKKERESGASSVRACLLFYLASLIVGILAFPLTFSLFPRLADRGGGVARVLGLVLTTYLMMLALQLRLLPNGRGTALASLAALAVISAAVLRRRRREVIEFLRQDGRLLAHGEIAFAAGFLLFLGFRALNPEIYWGEKPMDFSILNVLVRAPHFPPSDPWFAGAPLGYYYFGQEMIALLTLATGISTRYTFNLAFGLIGGLTLQAAFTLLRNWAGNLRAAFAGAAFSGILGNLAGLREWLINQPAAASAAHIPASQARHLDWHYFWATSRVVPNTINEYPFWSLLFADLHAHVLAFPLFFLFASASLQLVRSHADSESSWRERTVSALLLGFCAAAQALTNAWDAPLLAGLLVVVFLAAALSRRRIETRGVARALLSFLLAASSALGLMLLLWVRGGGTPGYGKNGEAPARGVDVVTVFGLFFFLAVAWWIGAARRRAIDRGWPPVAATVLAATVAVGLAVASVTAPTIFCAACVVLFLAAAIGSRGPAEDRLAIGFAATAFLLILFTQRFYIYDRMNTFFKLYLEAWFLFSIACAALVFRAPDRPASFARWKSPARLAFYALVAAALFTTMTVARGAVDARLGRPAPPDYRGSSTERVRFGGPTLDGLHYLEVLRPGEYQAVLWLRRTIRGTPVVLEAQGSSYQDFGRISMLTGLPTVLGWDYHVQQRGNPSSEIDARKEAVRAIYKSADSSSISLLLARYHVGYVYVGWLERQTYPAAGLAKFDKDKDRFELAYENPQTRIYRIIGGPAQDVPVPTREEIKAPSSTGAPRPPEDEPEEAPQISEKPQEGLAPFAQMKEPRDGAVDGKGRVWITDFGNSRLRVFDEKGGLLGGWGGRGSGTYGLREPCAVAIRGDDLYIADTWNGRVEHFGLEGEAKETVTGLYGPRGVAVAPDRTVWVTDTGNHRVIQYGPDLTQKSVAGKMGSGREEFSGPVGIAVSPSGAVYVADAGNQRIQVLSSSGAFVKSIPFPGWKERGIEPHLEVDPNGILYATDPAAGRVLALDASGTVMHQWRADDTGRPFQRPTGVALDAKKGILFVINSGDSSVSEIQLPEGKTR